jgi:thiosulfate reductase cytochrome b subunit
VQRCVHHPDGRQWIANTRGLSSPWAARRAIFLVSFPEHRATAVAQDWRLVGGRSSLAFRDHLVLHIYHLRLRKSPPAEDFYNGLQRLAYTGVLLGVVMTVSGLAIYKPVQFYPLTMIFGGYDGARAVHLLGLCSLMLFAATHIVLVTLHPREIVDMMGGGKRD